MAKILVTGAGGLIGSDISEYLSSLGHEIVGTVRQRKQAVGNNFCIDLSKKNLDLTQIFHGIKGVVHTAAVVPNKNTNPNNDQNRILTQIIDQNIADFCTKTDIPVVYISSCGIYDLTCSKRKYETSSIFPVTPYHSAKIMGESLFLKNKKAIIARIPSPYGPKIKGETVLSVFFREAFNSREINIWGTGNREQDFIHVRDISRFIEMAIFSNKSGVYNVCSGEVTTMFELAEYCVKVCGTGKIVFNNKNSPEENYFPYYSAEKAKKLLNWSCNISLEDGLKSILDTWKYNEN